jgi:hypothetical protein
MKTYQINKMRFYANSIISVNTVFDYEAVRTDNEIKR